MSGGMKVTGHLFSWQLRGNRSSHFLLSVQDRKWREISKKRHRWQKDNSDFKSSLSIQKEKKCFGFSYTLNNSQLVCFSFHCTLCQIWLKGQYPFIWRMVVWKTDWLFKSLWVAAAKDADILPLASLKGMRIWWMWQSCDIYREENYDTLSHLKKKIKMKNIRKSNIKWQITI